MKRLFIKSVLAVAALATVGSVLAQERVIKFANQNSKGHPIVQGMDKFAELVAAKSGGKMTVKVFAGGILGSDQANVSALQGGTLEMASMNSGIFASLAKEFAIYDFPFLFANGKEADTVVDGPFGKHLHSLLEPKGIVGLAYYELGFRHITNSKRPINKVEDLEGLKLRVIPNPINVDWVKALGANPTPMPFPELYAGLEQHAVDGQENPLPTINSAKLYEVQKYLVLTSHQYNPQSVVISKKFWDSLSAADKKILQDSATESAKYEREQTRGQAASILENLKKNGMQVTELSKPEMEKLRSKMTPVIAKYSVSVGQETISEVQAILTKLRK